MIQEEDEEGTPETLKSRLTAPLEVGTALDLKEDTEGTVGGIREGTRAELEISLMSGALPMIP